MARTPKNEPVAPQAIVSKIGEGIPAPKSEPVSPLAPKSSQREEDPENRPIPAYTAPEFNRDGRSLGQLAADVFRRLLIVLGLVGASAFIWKTYQDRLKPMVAAHPSRLRAQATLSLGPQRTLHVVVLDGQRWLIGSTPQQVSLLAVLDSDAEPSAAPHLDTSPEPQGSFQDLLFGCQQRETTAAGASDSAANSPSVSRVSPVEAAQLRAYLQSAERREVSPLETGTDHEPLVSRKATGRPAAHPDETLFRTLPKQPNTRENR